VGYQTGKRGICVVNSMQIETVTGWDIRQGKGGFVLSTACKLKLEMSGISDRGKGGLCSQQHAN
jgi:hypothetical protein